MKPTEATTGKPIPKTAKTVTVASKLPMSIELQLCRPITRPVQGRYGQADETIFAKHGPIVTIRGTARANGQTPDGYVAPEIVAGAAITRGVSADFFQEWLKQNQTTEIVASGLIFAAADVDSVRGYATERVAELSGLDPINPRRDAKGDMMDKRVPRPMDPSVGKLETAERGAA